MSVNLADKVAVRLGSIPAEEGTGINNSDDGIAQRGSGSNRFALGRRWSCVSVSLF
jgi:hypothetical protein